MIQKNLMLCKKINLMILFLSGAIFFLSSCDKNDDFSGPPSVTQVRLLSNKDSIFTKAFPGTQIIIEGQNLGGIQEIYFNGHQAGFNPVYNTNTNIIVTIPSNAPTEATMPNAPDEIRIITDHGEVTYTFKLDIPPPVIFGILNENALAGDSMVIFGANLWLVSKVLLPGNNEVTTVVSNPDGSRLSFVLPDLNNAEGRLTIQAKYGSVTSSAPINKHEGDSMISNFTASWQTGETSVFNWAWWGAVQTDDASKFPGTRGGYLQNIFGGVGANDGGWWNGNRSGNFDEVTLFTDAIRSQQASDYALKFEINTIEPWTSGIQVLRFNEDYAYRFMPYTTAANKSFNTMNEWLTVTIPLSEFKTASGGVEGTGNNANTMDKLVKAGGKVAFSYRFISEAEPISLFNAAYDNIRIVKIK
jgi:hypothetical protein